MTTKAQRIHVTLDPSDYECLALLSKKKSSSLSSLVKMMVQDWLEEYEDMRLAIKAEQIEKEWIAQGRPTISHEELWKKLGIESSTPPKPKKKSVTSQRKSRDVSKKPSMKG